MNMLSFYNQLKKKASVAEWSIATDCKSVDESLRWFKSNPAHTFTAVFLLTFFALFSAITVNVSAQFAYSLELDGSRENAIFETENADNPDFTFFYTFVEDAGDCLTELISSEVSRKSFDPNETIKVSGSNAHNKFLCITENDGSYEYQPVAPLYIVNRKPDLDLTFKKVKGRFETLENTYDATVNDDLDYNDHNTGRLVWGYVPFSDICNSRKPKDVASLFGLTNIEDHQKPTYEKYDEKYGENFVSDFVTRPGNLQDITQDEGATIKIKLIQDVDSFLTDRTNERYLCFLSAHPAHDAYAVKLKTLRYTEENSGRTDGGIGSVNYSATNNFYNNLAGDLGLTQSSSNIPTISGFFTNFFDNSESSGAQNDNTNPEFSNIENGQIVPCGDGKKVSNKCRVSHFIKLSSNIFKYLAFYLFIPLATFGVLFSGLKFLFFAESAEARNAAKNNLIWTVVAFILVFGAYVLVDYFFVLTGVGELNELIKNNI